MQRLVTILLILQLPGVCHAWQLELRENATVYDSQQIDNPLRKEQRMPAAQPQIELSKPATTIQKLSGLDSTVKPAGYSVPQPLTESAMTGAIPDAQASSYENITPGLSSTDDLLQQLGEPLEKLKDDAEELWTYEPEKLKQVIFFNKRGVITSVVLYLKRPSSRDEIIRQLNLKGLSSAEVRDNNDALLGEVFPERGIMFSFSADSLVADKELMVEHVVLEPITTAPFLLRVKQDSGFHFQRSIGDLNWVLQNDHRSAEAHWLKARLMREAGHPRDAYRLASEAIKLEPGNTDYQLTHARAGAELGLVSAAEEQLQMIANSARSQDLHRAEAELLLGEILMRQARPEYKQALSYQQQTIQLTKPLVDHQRSAIRQKARKLLIEAHLDIAYNIAAGDWSKKSEVVPQWYSQGEILAKAMIEQGEMDPLYRLRVERKVLEALAAMQSTEPVSNRVDALTRFVIQQYERAEDPFFKRQIRQELGLALLAGARIELRQQRMDAARKNLLTAIDFWEQEKKRDGTAAGQYLTGKIYFMLGSLEAIHQDNHVQAMKWYEKSLPLLTRTIPPAKQHELSEHGDRLVSMGVTYWKLKRHQVAIDLTHRGLKLMEDAVQAGATSAQQLAVPYGNLVSMYRFLGKDETAAKVARQIELMEANTRQR